MRRRIIPPTAILAVLMIAAAGCVGSVPVADDTRVPTTSPPTTPPPTTGPTTTSPGTTQPSFLAPAVECSGDEWVAFWGLGENSRQRFWEPDVARVGYTVPGDQTVFFVAYVDGEVAGVEDVYYEGNGSVTADGARVRLDEPLSGVHTIRVVAHQDSDGDGEFDAGTDRPCKNDGEVVQTGVERLNFSELEGTSTPERTTGG